MLLLNQAAFASKALYSITPETSSTVQVPLNSTATVTYRVQNQTQQTQSLSLQNSFGVTQAVQSGFCDNPFTLTPNESCLLSLVVDGSKITSSKAIVGPEICKTNSSFFCSLPSLENRLNIQITTPTPSETHILIANSGTADVGFISDCVVGDAGSLDNCQTFSDTDIERANGVATTTSQYLYTANNNSNTITICSFDTNLTACVQDNAGGLLNGPRTVYTHNNDLYIVNGGNNSVIKCDINSTDGSVSGCVATGSGFANPLGSMTIANGYAYIPNSNASGTGGNISISICSVDAVDGTLSGCSIFNDPSILQQATTGITISGAYAYIIGLNFRNVVACEVNASDGTLSNCNNNTGILTNNAHLGIAILNDYVYVSSSNKDAVEKCPVTGLIVSTCESTGSGFDGPAGNMTFITR